MVDTKLTTSANDVSAHPLFPIAALYFINLNRDVARDKSIAKITVDSFRDSIDLKNPDFAKGIAFMAYNILNHLPEKEILDLRIISPTTPEDVQRNLAVRLVQLYLKEKKNDNNFLKAIKGEFVNAARLLLEFVPQMQNKSREEITKALATFYSNHPQSEGREIFNQAVTLLMAADNPKRDLTFNTMASALAPGQQLPQLLYLSVLYAQLGTQGLRDLISLVPAAPSPTSTESLPRSQLAQQLGMTEEELRLSQQAQAAQDRAGRQKPKSSSSVTTASGRLPSGGLTGIPTLMLQEDAIARARLSGGSGSRVSPPSGSNVVSYPTQLERDFGPTAATSIINSERRRREENAARELKEKQEAERRAKLSPRERFEEDKKNYDEKYALLHVDPNVVSLSSAERGRREAWIKEVNEQKEKQYASDIKTFGQDMADIFHFGLRAPQLQTAAAEAKTRIDAQAGIIADGLTKFNRFRRNTDEKKEPVDALEWVSLRDQSARFRQKDYDTLVRQYLATIPNLGEIKDIEQFLKSDVTRGGKEFASSPYLLYQFKEIFPVVSAELVVEQKRKEEQQKRARVVSSTSSAFRPISSKSATDVVVATGIAKLSRAEIMVELKDAPITPTELQEHKKAVSELSLIKIAELANRYLSLPYVRDQIRTISNIEVFMRKDITRGGFDLAQDPLILAAVKKSFTTLIQAQASEEKKKQATSSAPSSRPTEEKKKQEAPLPLIPPSTEEKKKQEAPSATSTLSTVRTANPKDELKKRIEALGASSPLPQIKDCLVDYLKLKYDGKKLPDLNALVEVMVVDLEYRGDKLISDITAVSGFQTSDGNLTEKAITFLDEAIREANTPTVAPTVVRT